MSAFYLIEAALCDIAKRFSYRVILHMKRRNLCLKVIHNKNYLVNFTDSKQNQLSTTSYQTDQGDGTKGLSGVVLPEVTES